MMSKLIDGHYTVTRYVDIYIYIIGADRQMTTTTTTNDYLITG